MIIILKRLVLFVALGIVFGNLFMVLFPSSQAGYVPSEVIIHAINLSKSRFDGRVLVIGDSVAKQLKLATYNPTIWDLTTNQAISLAGQYILANNAVRNNINIKKLVLLYHPQSFSNDLNLVTAFNYFCKPFVYWNNQNTWENSVKQRLFGKPYWLAYAPIIRHTRILGSLDFSEEPISQIAYLSEVTVDYIVKIDELCSEYEIEFIVISPPLSEVSTENIIELRTSIEANGLENVFRYYEQSVTYLPDSCFSDSIHIYGEHLELASSVAINELKQFE